VTGAVARCLDRQFGLKFSHDDVDCRRTHGEASHAVGAVGLAQLLSSECESRFVR
jgi:hypothetical protein